MTLQAEKEQLKLLLTKLINSRDEEEQKLLILEIDRVSPDPNHVDYIYQSDDFCNDKGEIDVDAVVEKIYSYQPIIL